MKFLLPLLIVTTLLWGEALSGKWVLNTLGSSRDVVVRQQQNHVELFRKITHTMDGAAYTVHHMIRGKVNTALGAESSLKLYVREDGTPKYEYLRMVPLKYINCNRMALDEVDLKRVVPIKKNVVVIPKEKETTKSNEIEIVIVKKDRTPQKKSAPTIDESMFMPQGLGDGGANVVKISKGLVGDHAVRFNRGVALKNAGKLQKAARILEALYSENRSIKGIAIVPHLAEIYQKMGKNSKVNDYCGIVKRYDPFLKCGGAK